MRLEEELRMFEGISLADMDMVRLMNRLDTKYVLTTDQLPAVLRDIQPYYYALDIDKERIFGYQSLYFDTEKNDMYLAHHNGKVNRYKVRMRKYMANEISFLEIKRKIKGTRTIKHRMRIENLDTILSENSRDYIQRYTPFKEQNLEPKIYTNFDRLTLVSKKLNERATVDLNLEFRHNGWEKGLQRVAIIELKRDGGTVSSPMLSTLLKHRIFPQGFSKYCIGRAMIEDNIKRNNFKERILRINKLDNGAAH